MRYSRPPSHCLATPLQLEFAPPDQHQTPVDILKPRHRVLTFQYLFFMSCKILSTGLHTDSAFIVNSQNVNDVE
jgi:hypothetical protein